MASKEKILARRELVKKIQEYDETISIKDIAKFLGVSRTTIEHDRIANLQRKFTRRELIIFKSVVKMWRENPKITREDVSEKLKCSHFTAQFALDNLPALVEMDILSKTNKI